MTYIPTIDEINTRIKSLRECVVDMEHRIEQSPNPMFRKTAKHDVENWNLEIHALETMRRKALQEKI